ncbi:unnamed protein product [Cercospora beticola]|nr:unnamed protein product [Cercospora beticola]
MTKPQHKRPPRSQKRGHDSTDVAEHPQSSGVRSNDQFVLPIRTAVASNGVNPDLLSRSNAIAPAPESSNFIPLLRPPGPPGLPVHLHSRSVSTDAAGNVSSDLSLGSALEGSNVDSRPRAPELLDPPVFYRSESVSVDGSGNVNSNLPLRSYPATLAFQSFNIIPPFRLPGPPHSPGFFPSGSLFNGEPATPVNAADTTNVDETEDPTGVEELVKSVKRLPTLELVYLAEVVEMALKARGIPRLGKVSYDPGDRPPIKFDKTHSRRMIKEGRRIDERKAKSRQRRIEDERDQRKLDEAMTQAVRLMQKIQNDERTKQDPAGLQL